MRAGARLAVVVFVAALVAVAAPAQAQQGLTLETRLSAAEAAVGEPFSLELSATSRDPNAVPQSPSLQVPRGFEVQGPSLSTQQRVELHGMTMTRSTGIVAVWTLVGSKPGRYTLGPASMMVNGRRVADRTVSVTIVPAGSGAGPTRRQRRSLFDPFDDFDPFDLWTKRLPGLRGLEPPDDEFEVLPPVPPEYAIDHPGDPVAFLEAKVEPPTAVVGEQVTLRIIAHGSRGPFREGYAAEPKRPDFLSHSIVENTYGEQTHPQKVGDQIWHSVKVRELALFPLKTGPLTIGPMTMDFEGPRYSSRRGMKGIRRQSRELTVSVTEPPLAGRPPGYQVGDVGKFYLEATVEPRQTPAGGAVSVAAVLRGTGSVPGSLRIPEQNGVEWLEPTTTEELEVRQGKLGGTRTLRYVVELQRPGTVDLGELRLPFWNPAERRYEVARAALGTVVVTPSPNAQTSADTKAPDPALDLLQERSELGPAARPPARLSDRPLYWLLLAIGPLGLVITGSMVRAGRWLSAKSKKARRDPKRVVATLIKEAAGLLKSGHAEAAIPKVEKAILSAIEGRTGLKARGVLRTELVAELVARGIPEPLGRECSDLLDECDRARFIGTSGGLDPSVVERAERAVEHLGRAKAVHGGRA